MSDEKKPYFVHESSYVDAGAQIGEGTKIWHFSHVYAKAKIGKKCIFGQNVSIADDVVIGNNVKVQNNVSIYTGVEIEDDVFLGPSCVLTNVTNPRSQVNRHRLYERTLIQRGATVGANATIVCGTTLGRYCFIAAGAVVTKDVPDYALVAGNPARWRAWVCRCGQKLSSASGRLLACACGRSYEQIAENEVKEANGCLQNLPGSRVAADLKEPIIQINGRHAANGR